MESIYISYKLTKELALEESYKLQGHPSSENCSSAKGTVVITIADGSSNLNSVR